MRIVYVDPSVCCTSCVKVYGRRGRLISVAWREGVCERGVCEVLVVWRSGKGKEEVVVRVVVTVGRRGSA